MGTLILALLLTGSVLLAIVFISFLLQVRIFGINILVFETIGIACISLAAGLQSFVVMLYVLLGGVVLAIFFDPFIWKWKGIEVPNDKTTSVVFNGIMGVTMIMFYALGTLLS